MYSIFRWACLLTPPRIFFAFLSWWYNCLPVFSYFATLKSYTYRVSGHNILRCAFIKLKTTETLYASVTLLIINSSQSAPEFIYYPIIYLCRVFSAEVWIGFCACFSRRIQSHQITFNNRRLSLRPNQTWKPSEWNGFLNIDQILIYFLQPTHCNYIRCFFLMWMCFGWPLIISQSHTHTLIYRD